MDELTIRLATLKDLKALYSFEQQLIETERHYDVTIQTGLIYYYNLKELISSRHAQIFVAELKNTLIACGYAYIADAKPHLKHQKYASLGFMYVVPTFRGRGINHLIIDKATEWCRANSITELRLDVYAENRSAIKAYEKAGFCKHLIEMRLNIHNPK